MKVKHLVVAFLCMLGCCACSSPKTEVKSPDGHIKMTLTVDENGTPFYNVSVNDSLLIENSKWVCGGKRCYSGRRLPDRENHIRQQR